MRFIDDGALKCALSDEVAVRFMADHQLPHLGLSDIGQGTPSRLIQLDATSHGLYSAIDKGGDLDAVANPCITGQRCVTGCVTFGLDLEGDVEHVRVVCVYQEGFNRVTLIWLPALSWASGETK